MTNEVKAIFDKLYKDMEGGIAHKQILAENISPIQADDKFHSLVMQAAKTLTEKPYVIVSNKKVQ
jgi:hypothetical protein